MNVSVVLSMEPRTDTTKQPRLLPKARLQALLDTLWRQGHRVLGPLLRDGGPCFDEVHQVRDLPVGLRDEQEPGRYRLVAGSEGEIFGVVNGPGSLKPELFAPEEALLEIRRQRKGFSVSELGPEVPPLAFVGVRACDLAAVAVQDRIFLHDQFRDSHYATRRERVLLIAVNCTHSAATCFCASMGSGPEATRGYDLALTELEDAFVVHEGSAAGRAITDELELDPASPAMISTARDGIAACAAGMRRHVDTSELPQLLYDEAENPHWDEVARRCLSCTNCTMVCPTCFCHTVVDTTRLNGDSSRRVRLWDSCFSLEHAHTHGKNFRPRIHDRYRQWLTHKLASWIDQFGVSGCVGCGRCITWCPVGIDLTAELAAIQANRRPRETA